jgi:hypothetical protein
MARDMSVFLNHEETAFATKSWFIPFGCTSGYNAELRVNFGFGLSPVDDSRGDVSAQ